MNRFLHLLYLFRLGEQLRDERLRERDERFRERDERLRERDERFRERDERLRERLRDERLEDEKL